MDERRTLIRAARKVVRRSGFNALKVDRVLKEAGLSRRAFYRAFPGKNGLLFALFREDSDMLCRRLEQACGDERAPIDRLQSWVTSFLTVGVEPASGGTQRFASRQFSTLAEAHPAEAAALQSSVVQTIVPTLVELGVPDPDEVAYALVQVCRAWLFDSPLGASRPSVAATARVVMRTAQASIPTDPVTTF